MPAELGVLFAGVTNRVKVRVEDSGSGVDPAGVIINNIAATRNDDGTFSVELNNLTVGEMIIPITARDVAGNTGRIEIRLRVLRYGDVDGSGSVDISDLVKLLQMLSGAERLEGAPGADLSQDGAVGTTDLITLLQLLQGIPITGQR